MNGYVVGAYLATFAGLGLYVAHVVRRFRILRRELSRGLKGVE